MQVFAPAEKIENPLLINLVYCQIVLDSYADNCIRMSKDDKRKMTSFIGKTLTAFKSTACLQVEEHLAARSPWAVADTVGRHENNSSGPYFFVYQLPSWYSHMIDFIANWTASEYS